MSEPAEDWGLEGFGDEVPRTAIVPSSVPLGSGESNSSASSSSTASKSKSKRTDQFSNEKPVELGFVEDYDDEEEDSIEAWKLTSPFFPSKLGGKPAWLDLKNLPSFDQVKCTSCGNPTKFLLQIYAPLDAPETFHRTIFIFVCSQQACCVERNSNKNLIAFRCQLERVNEFYPAEPPSYNDSKLATEITPEKFDVKLCRICGSKGVAHCSKCKKTNYCGKEHQALDWKCGHKNECNDPDFKPESCISSNTHNFKEYEITIDKEVLPQTTGKEKKDALEEYKRLAQEGKTGTVTDDAPSTKDLLEAMSYKSDKAFNKFRKRIACNPEQVLRYDRGGEPLWVSSEKIPTEDTIPKCNYCGGPRSFEFQVMPQLLNNLGEDSRSGALDWGTFAVYTCKNSCTEGNPYKTEFIWLQHFQDVSNDKDEKSDD